MAEFVVKIADERGHIQQHIEQGISEAEVRDRFAQQGYLVYWVKPRSLLTTGAMRRGKLKQATFLIFNQQFLTLIKAGLPILTWLRFFFWLIIGLCLYAAFGRRHSVLAAKR